MTPLCQKKLFLFDIDGTIAVGDTLYDGSRELFDYIHSIGGQAYYITNNSTKSNADYVTKFRNAFGLETTENLFITSGYMTTKFLKETYADKLIYVLGTASFIAELRRNGLEITEEFSEEIACAVVAYDSELTYEKLCVASKVLSILDIPFYGTNPDLCCPIDFGFIPDCGAICEMLTHATGKVPVYLGKPNAEVVHLCQVDSGFSDDETLVIGDRLYTDIACGINAGVDTCVLFTGEATKEDLKTTKFVPTYAFEDVTELLKNCKKA